MLLCWWYFDKFILMLLCWWRFDNSYWCCCAEDVLVKLTLTWNLPCFIFHYFALLSFTFHVLVVLLSFRSNLLYLRLTVFFRSHSAFGFRSLDVLLLVPILLFSHFTTCLTLYFEVLEVTFTSFTPKIIASF